MSCRHCCSPIIFDTGWHPKGCTPYTLGLKLPVFFDPLAAKSWGLNSSLTQSLPWRFLTTYLHTLKARSSCTEFIKMLGGHGWVWMRLQYKLLLSSL